MSPNHLIKDLIKRGEYISPHQCWYEIEDQVSRIYTKSIIVNLSIEITREL